jgi:ribose 5-phosphate isomerase B
MTARQRDNSPLHTKKADIMRVGIATDHRGFALKEELVANLLTAGYEVVDYGAAALTSGDDYPDVFVVR